MKNIISTVVCVMCGICLAATPQVKNVKAFQQYPWGKVYITYEVVGDVAAAAEGGATPILIVTAKDKTTGRIYDEAFSMYLSGDTSDTAGLHKIIWDISAQGVPISSNNVAIDVAYHDADELYIVVDLSSGPDSISYPISRLYAAPSGGWTDEYKTTKLVLRRIMPGSFKMGGRYNVTLSIPFYIGVFEVTQKQYELVMGSNPSFCYSKDKRPVDSVSYALIRGSSAGTGWPGSSAVDSDSFLGKIRARTGLNFDLPTEAQWEYACRAKTTTDYNTGEGIDEVGRYKLNGGCVHVFSENSGKWSYKLPTKSESISYGTAIVGSYKPNAWGLYDMHGNVAELCLDRFGDLSDAVTDPVGASSGVRVERGGGFAHEAKYCTSSFRGKENGYYEHGESYSHIDASSGFRLARTLSD